MNKLSIVLATYNEESNISHCLKSVKDIADEIIIIDGSSLDKTVEIAKKNGAKVIVTQNHPIFHINKQKALDEAKNEWVLQLDADERVSSKLSDEILKVINFDKQSASDYQKNLPDKDLFLRHKKLLEKRDGNIGANHSEYSAYFIPRLNYFLGKYLRYGGVYPDGVIRLVKKRKAHFPCIDVHEQIIVNGQVGWLQNSLYHKDSPTFSRYLERNNRYTDLLATQMKARGTKINLSTALNYLVIKPVSWMIVTQIRHKGILDGWQGFVFSFFSSLRFPISYVKYIKKTFNI